jgi:hypothetical protein
MDLFKFTANPGSPTTLVGGEPINGYLSAMWVERYQECGEFEIRASLSSGLREFLPLDTFISHIATLEVMIVENHEIIDEKDADSVLIITGRSMPSILDRRTTSVFVKYNVTGNAQNNGGYDVVTNYPSMQVIGMINATILAGYSTEMFDNISMQSIVTGESNAPARQIKNSDLLKATIDMLAYNDLGIRTQRRNSWGATGSSATVTNFIIYKGSDKTKTVVFSYERGDITKANYLWTNKDYKNGVILFGQRYATFYDATSDTRFNYKAAYLDVADIEGGYDYPEYPTDTTAINNIVAKMKLRGQAYLATKTKKTLIQADVSPYTNYMYRRDYDLGDLVMIDGNYQQMQIMRVIEHVEVEDENGSSAHPTLALPPS